MMVSLYLSKMSSILSTPVLRSDTGMGTASESTLPIVYSGCTIQKKTCENIPNSSRPECRCLYQIPFLKAGNNQIVVTFLSVLKWPRDVIEISTSELFSSSSKNLGVP